MLSLAEIYTLLCQSCNASLTGKAQQGGKTWDNVQEKIEEMDTRKHSNRIDINQSQNLQYLLVDKNIVLTTEANKLLIDLKKTYFFCKEN